MSGRGTILLWMMAPFAGALAVFGPIMVWSVFDPRYGMGWFNLLLVGIFSILIAAAWLVAAISEGRNLSREEAAGEAPGTLNRPRFVRYHALGCCVLLAPGVGYVLWLQTQGLL